MPTSKVKPVKVIKINLYSFDQLSEAVKQTVLEKNYDINVSFDWWDCVYDDAKNIGLQLNGFDLDRGFCDGNLIDSAPEIANKILTEHGEICESYKTAKCFLTDYDALVCKYSDGINKNVVSEENEYDFDNEANDLEEEFKRSLLEDYGILLKQEYEYLTGKEAIIETIQANDYTFEIDGKMNNG